MRRYIISSIEIKWKKAAIVAKEGFVVAPRPTSFFPFLASFHCAIHSPFGMNRCAALIGFHVLRFCALLSRKQHEKFKVSNYESVNVFSWLSTFRECRDFHLISLVFLGLENCLRKALLNTSDPRGHRRQPETSLEGPTAQQLRSILQLRKNQKWIWMAYT